MMQVVFLFFAILSTKKSRGCCTLKTVLIFIVVEVVVILVTAGVVFFITFRSEPYMKKSCRKIESRLTLSKLLNGSFRATGFNGSWISDNEIFMQNSDGEYVIYDLTKKIETKLMTNKTLIEKTHRVELSADRKYLLVTYDSKAEFRWSSNFSALIYNIETQNQKVLQNSEGKPLSLQLFKWNSVGNGFSYVYSNNIYYRSNASSNEECQISKNGSPTIFNGICDWVYEEEIFEDSSAIWYSPDGRKLVYASFNDTNTDVMPVTYYGEGRSMDFQYPKLHNIRYPKAGRTNPTVQLYIVDADGCSTISRRVIEVCTIFPQQILISVTWINNIKLAMVVMNRVQNKAAVLLNDLQTGVCEKILDLENDKGWVEMSHPMFTSDGQYMLYIYSWDQGNNLGGYQHLTMYNIAKKTLLALTMGKFSVTRILAWDKINNIVYFTATEEDKAMNQQIYSVKINESMPEKPDCISCAIEKTCNFWEADFSQFQSYRAQTCLGPSIPYVKIFEKNNNEVLLWEENKPLKENLINIPIPNKLFLKIRVTSDIEVDVQLRIPPTVDQSGKEKYPLLVYVYGGPNSNQVLNTFKVNWDLYFALNYNTIIATIDGRGSSFRGDKFLYTNYRHLGGVEVDDQINVTKQLQEKFSFIDETRTGIWGWSYGGYVTGMALAKDSQNVFKCGVSVAPVTDWIYYDTMYTERYMGLPTENDNLAGYESSSLLNIAKQLKGKKYLLVHGSNDDNVHFQQSMMLARNLQKNNIEFSQLVYTNEKHSLSGVKNHLYRNLESFFSDCFA